MIYPERVMSKIIKEICAEDDLVLRQYEGDWVNKITSGDKSAIIYGYKFPLNDAAVCRLCDDKAALAEVLTSEGVECVTHKYFDLSSPKAFVVEAERNAICQMYRQYGAVVLKPNNGTGGHNVLLCQSINELNAAIDKVLGSTKYLAVSPKVDIVAEYRTIIEDCKPKLIYSKIRPFVIGDGKHSIEELMVNMHITADDIMPGLNMQAVPQAGDKATVGWKHNLGQGSTPEILTDPIMLARIKEIVAKVVQVINIRFASVDIVADATGKLQVLEINSGVMMEYFASTSPTNYAIAKDIYRSAIRHCLGLD